MSVSGFRTACVDTLGMPPLAYLRRFRIHRAAQRLRHERATILSIAFAAGFGSISQFDRAFRDVMGVSPRAFRAASGRSATSAPRDGSPPPG
jgi:AraC-like DNA-binding protein